MHRAGARRARAGAAPPDPSRHGGEPASPTRMQHQQWPDPEPEPEPEPKPEPKPEPEPEPQPRRRATKKVTASTEVAGAISTAVFLEALASSMEGVVKEDITVKTFEMKVASSASVPCAGSGGFTETMKDEFKQGVMFATNATDVVVDTVTGCGGRRRRALSSASLESRELDVHSRRRLQDSSSTGASVAYTVTTTDSGAAVGIAEVMANTTRFAAALVTSINNNGGFGGSTLNASDLVASAKAPTITTAISYEVIVPPTVDETTVTAVASDSDSMLGIVQSAAAAVDIPQSIESSSLAVSATATDIAAVVVVVPDKVSSGSRSSVLLGASGLAVLVACCAY